MSFGEASVHGQLSLEVRKHKHKTVGSCPEKNHYLGLAITNYYSILEEVCALYNGGNMEMKKQWTFNVAYILSVLFILLVLTVIGTTFYHIYNDDIDQHEENIFNELAHQASLIDARMAEIIDRGELQRYWIEELPMEEVHSIDLSSYKWLYHEDLNVTSLVQTHESYGGIFIKGTMDELTKDQEMTIKRMLASFPVRHFMIDHIEFSSWAIYYSDYDVISTYPYEDVYELFDPNGISAEETFEYIKSNIAMLREGGSQEDYSHGWESYLNPDLNGNGVVYSRNWTIFDGERIGGIYQSATDLEPLNNLFDMPYDNDNIYIVDPGNQLAYDNGHAPTEIRTFSLFDLNRLDGFQGNPYGEGLYKNNSNVLTYILPLESTNWRLIYQVPIGSVTGPSLFDYMHFYIYVVLTLVSGFFLLRYVYRTDMQKRKEEAMMRESLQVDYLTGTLNKKMLNLKIGEFIEFSDSRPFCMVMLDIDDFKSVNDTYGHGFGDKVLVQVAKTIKESLRANDIVCRFGGEEFVILLADSNQTLSVDICHRILNNIRKDTTENFGIPVTVSMGLAKYSKKYDGQALLEKADSNLYEAKRKGKDQVVGSFE